MSGVSDLKDKKVVSQRNTIADLKGSLCRANLAVKQVKEDEQAQFKRAEKERKRASSWKTTAKVAHQCKSAAEEQTKSSKEARETLAAELETMRHNY